MPFFYRLSPKNSFVFFLKSHISKIIKISHIENFILHNYFMFYWLLILIKSHKLNELFIS